MHLPNIQVPVIVAQRVLKSSWLSFTPPRPPANESPKFGTKRIISEHPENHHSCWRAAVFGLNMKFFPSFANRRLSQWIPSFGTSSEKGQILGPNRITPVVQKSSLHLGPATSKQCSSSQRKVGTTQTGKKSGCRVPHFYKQRVSSLWPLIPWYPNGLEQRWMGGNQLRFQVPSSGATDFVAHHAFTNLSTSQSRNFQRAMCESY